MIQKTNARLSSTAANAPLRETISDGSEQWGQWLGRKHYSLEVVQHPLRARMCGFGDKDRRPLAPAAVAKMIVRSEDNTLVDVDDVDCSFFLVTVDLWSADGKHEMNLVLHPSSADRYVPTHTSKPRRRTSGPLQRSGRSTPTQCGDAQSATMTCVMQPQAAGYGPQSPITQQQASIPESMGFQPASTFNSPPESSPSWGYPPHNSQIDRGNYSTTVLPSIQSFGRNAATTGVESEDPPSADSWHPEGSIRDDAQIVAYRGWSTDDTYHAVENPHSFGPPVDPSLRGVSNSQPSHSSHGDGNQWHQPAGNPAPANRYPQEPYSPPGPAPQFDHSMYVSASHVQHQSQSLYYAASYPPSQNTSPLLSSSTPLPRHTYTRTLVGPLSANACRLLDEHRKPGIFFLFQDLSVRTEGKFRLRLRLMNVGAPPAPEVGALRVHTDVSPVLAQTFTEQFVVFSAKRFPGVPDTTALSIALGNQGQKLPLRNRHGSSKQGRRRARGESDGSDDDSDGG